LSENAKENLELSLKVNFLEELFGDKAKTTEHDMMRARKLLQKHPVHSTRVKKVALMASRITHPDKAFRRAKAFEFMGLPEGKKIMVEKCWELLGNL